MTAFAPGGRLWTRRSGYSSYSLFLRLRGPAVETVGHASPSVHFGPASSSASFHGHTTITAHHDPTFKPSSAGNVDSTHQPVFTALPAVGTLSLFLSLSLFLYREYLPFEPPFRFFAFDTFHFSIAVLEFVAVLELDVLLEAEKLAIGTL